ncbi:MAG: EthD family reductase [Anaerolineae bacterium]
MVKLIALYKKPEDPEAFDRHYEEVHVPLIRKVPGLVRLDANRVLGAPGGRDSPYYLMAEMVFEDRAGYDAAMASPENREAGKDLMSFAGELVTMMVVEQQPEAGEEQPAAGEQQPEAGEQQPATGEQQPEAGEGEAESGAESEGG